MESSNSASKFAILAPTDEAYGYGRMFKAFRAYQDGETRNVEVFRTKQEVMGFLGLAGLTWEQIIQESVIGFRPDGRTLHEHPVAPPVDCDQQHPALMVTDVLAAVDFYTTKLAFTLGFTWGDPPTFAGVNLDKVQLFLNKGHTRPHRGARCTSGSDPPTELYEFQRARGVEIVCTTRRPSLWVARLHRS
jgi:hypothetical protein